jgi:hypothetical protein
VLFDAIEPLPNMQEPGGFALDMGLSVRYARITSNVLEGFLCYSKEFVSHPGTK